MRVNLAKVFLDVGAHIGESLEIGLHRKYNFDKFLVVEPSKFGINFLSKFKDERIKIYHLGFSDKNEKVILYGSGSVGASIFADKKRNWSNQESVSLVRFSEWYGTNISESDLVWIKINVEGAEKYIIPEFSKIEFLQNIQSVLVSFDVDKIPSQYGESTRLKLILLEQLKIPFIERTKNFQVKEWLDTFPDLKAKLGIYQKLVMLFRFDIPLNRNLRRVLKPIFPKKMWLSLARLFGPNRTRLHKIKT